MESVTRWIFIALAAVLAWMYLPKLMGGGGSADVQPIGPGRTETAIYVTGPGDPAKCEIQGNKYSAVLSARGAALVDFYMTGDERYTEHGKPIELTTVAGSAPDRFALHFDWRALRTTGDNAQVASDVVDWTIDARDASSCTFGYTDGKVKLTKTIRAGAGPFEIVARGTIENLSSESRVHRLGVENTSFRTHTETDSHLGRQSPVATEVACGHDGGKLDRKTLSDFEPKAFEKPEYEAGWFVNRGAVSFAATDNAYFAQALVPLEGPPPACALQVEERWSWDKYPDKSKAADLSAMYRSRLVYPSKELAPHETATYEVGAYYGPKDRDALGRAFAGKFHLSEIINLGMFSVVSKVLVMFLIKAQNVVGNWGIAIIVLIDELNRKFKDDPQQKQVAMMEVYRKNGVNPLGGCLPVVVQMPVWWALYTVLQTAVELYHTPFLWFRDLSAPDPYFLLPIVIGSASFVQQKMMPQQADVAQQKMMLYFMPAVFTVMMLFLPAGLGIYMLTNSILGIVQQQAVERFAPRTNGIEVRESDGDGSGRSPGDPGNKKSPGAKLAGTLPAKLKGGS